MTLRLFYWNSKGWVEPSRLLLHYLKVDYEEITWKDYDGYLAKKEVIFTDPLKTPFPNFPILIDGDFVLSEHEVINYYLCKKYNRLDLYGKNLQDEVRVRQMNALMTKVYDLIIDNAIVGGDYTTFLTNAFKEDGDIAQSIQSLAGFLADKDFLVGYLTLSDFRASYQLKYFRNAALSVGLEDPIVGKHDNLVALIKRVDGLPELEGYFGSARDHQYTPEVLAHWFKEFPLRVKSTQRTNYREKLPFW